MNVYRTVTVCSVVAIGALALAACSGASEPTASGNAKIVSCDPSVEDCSGGGSITNLPVTAVDIASGAISFPSGPNYPPSPCIVNDATVFVPVILPPQPIQPPQPIRAALENWNRFAQPPTPIFPPSPCLAIMQRLVTFNVSYNVVLNPDFTVASVQPIAPPQPI
jgi:hypothetical protein